MDKRLAETLRKYQRNYPKRLAASFPHVERAISLMWGSPEIYKYFDRLFLQDRQERKGFPPDVIQEIQGLRWLHEKVFPSSTTKHDIWHLSFSK